MIVIRQSLLGIIDIYSAKFFIDDPPSVNLYSLLRLGHKLRWQEIN